MRDSENSTTITVRMDIPEKPREVIVGAKPHVMTCVERDLELSLCAQQILPLLFSALQSHALGTIDDRSLDTIPPRERAVLHQIAEGAVQRVSTYRRDRAKRLATIAARRWMESFLHAPIASAMCEGTDIGIAVNKALYRFIDDLLTACGETNLVNETIQEYEDALRRPLPNLGGAR